MGEDKIKKQCITKRPDWPIIVEWLQFMVKEKTDRHEWPYERWLTEIHERVNR